MTAANLTSVPRWHEDAPLLPAEHVREFGPTLVVAAHPDDEALGCGGAMALLGQAGLPIRVVILSDGAASHPGSVRYPPPVLANLRRSESLAGLAYLGVMADQVTFFGLPDGAVPDAGSLAGDRAVERLRDSLLGWPEFQTVLLPWRRDPHNDHRAAWSLATAAFDAMSSPARRLEYPIWSVVHPGPDDVPRPGEATVWRLDTNDVSTRKRAAIRAHLSQTTTLIDDAEISECLTDEVLERFARPWEVYIEVGEVTR